MNDVPVLDRCCERCEHFHLSGTLPDRIFGGVRTMGRCTRGRGEMDGRAYCQDWMDCGVVKRFTPRDEYQAWTTPEENHLRQLYAAGLTPEVVAQRLGRSIDSVRNKAREIYRGQRKRGRPVA